MDTMTVTAWPGFRNRRRGGRVRGKIGGTGEERKWGAEGSHEERERESEERETFWNTGKGRQTLDGLHSNKNSDSQINFRGG